MNPTNGHPPAATALRLANRWRVEQWNSSDLAIFGRRRFLEPELCAELIAEIERVRRPSTIADANGDPTYRTSETGDLDSAIPAIAEAEARINALLGITAEFGEPLQGQRYEAGQEFKRHTDYFEPDSPDYHRFCADAGNRTWTAMVYLNQPLAGGGTSFEALGQVVEPEVGMLVTWCNRRNDGEVNPASMHAGLPVRQGLKYIITKWYRERPYR